MIITGGYTPNESKVVLEMMGQQRQDMKEMLLAELKKSDHIGYLPDEITDEKMRQYFVPVKQELTEMAVFNSEFAKAAQELNFSRDSIWDWIQDRSFGGKNNRIRERAITSLFRRNIVVKRPTADQKKKALEIVSKAAQRACLILLGQQVSRGRALYHAKMVLERVSLGNNPVSAVQKHLQSVYLIAYDLPLPLARVRKAIKAINAQKRVLHSLPNSMHELALCLAAISGFTTPLSQGKLLKKHTWIFWEPLHHSFSNKQLLLFLWKKKS